MKDDDDKTMLGMEISRSNANLIRAIGQLAAIIITFFAVMAIFGGLQLALCRNRDPEITVEQCFTPLREQRK